MSFLESLPTDLQSKIKNLIFKLPESELVLEEFYDYLVTPESKRKRPATEISKPVDEISNLQGYHIVLQLPELSVLSPLRKKLNFIIAAKDDKKILALTKSINDPEVVPDFILDDLSLSNIQLAVVLPIPEKKNIKYIAMFYKRNYNETFKNEPLLIALNFDVLNQQWLPILQQLNYSDLVTYLQRQFQICGCNLSNPFAESAESFFVESYKGSKEGTLYFLPNHVIFGFKKPILVYESTEIESITYTSITRVTFNVTLHLSSGEKTEFSMIDQSEYEKINRYVQTKEFRDRSMAEEFKAQTKMKNNESEGILSQIAEEGGVQLTGAADGDDSDDEEEDANYQFGAEESDSGGSGASSGDDENLSASDDEDSEEEDEEEEDASGIED